MSDLEYEHISEIYAKEIVEIWSDKDVIKYTNIKNTCSLKDTEDRILCFINHDVFVVKYNSNVVGIIGCPCIDKDKGEYGIFYQFKKSVWGKGIATQSATWLLNYMKNKYLDITLYADVVSDNIASDKILKSLGFKWLSDNKNGFQCNGYKMDVKNYKLVL